VRGGKDSGSTPPPDPGVRSSSGGPMQRRHPRPVARRRCRIRRTRASGEKRGCLGASWEWGEFLRVLGEDFYRPGGRGRWRPGGGRRGGPGDEHGQHRARRPCSRAGGVLSWRRGSVGRRWRGHYGRQVAERKKERRGGPGGVLLVLPYLTAWVGAGEAGLDRGSVHGMATGPGANENSDGHSELDFFWILPARCSIKCPQEFEFQIFENGHCSSSTYWTRLPGIFLLQRKMMFCRNHISNFGYCHCFWFNLWLMFELSSNLNFG
jgi:hypothetical protein